MVYCREMLLLLLLGVVNWSAAISLDPLRWGFLGCGRITNDFATAVESLPDNEQQVYAFASRNATAAQEYAKRFGAKKWYDSYEKLAKDPDVDVVYVGTVNPTHYEIVHMLLDNGKNILCEKPLTLMKKHADELIAKAESKKLFFQEAVWSRFFPVYQRVREELPGLGPIKNTLVTKGQVSGLKGQRLVRKQLGGGAVKDIGQYTIQFALLANGNTMPSKIVGAAQLNNETIDQATSILLQWDDGRTAQLFVSVLANTPNEAFVFGTNGYIKIPDSFMSPDHFEVTHYDVQGTKDSQQKNTSKELYAHPKVDHGLKYGPNGAGMVYEAREVRRCLQQGLQFSPLMTHEDSKMILAVADEVLKQIGVSYEDLYKDGKWVGSDLHPEHDGT